MKFLLGQPANWMNGEKEKTLSYFTKRIFSLRRQTSSFDSIIYKWFSGQVASAREREEEKISSRERLYLE